MTQHRRLMVQGTAMIASCFLLSGERAERLVLPPPMSSGFHAGAQRSNGDMKVWCGVGESTSITASDLKALLHACVTGKARRPARWTTGRPAAAIGQQRRRDRNRHAPRVVRARHQSR